MALADGCVGSPHSRRASSRWGGLADGEQVIDWSIPAPDAKRRAFFKACHTKALARPMASRSDTSRASRAAIAADNVQPVPCVWRVSTLGRTKRSMPVASQKMSTASAPLPCPPLRARPRSRARTAPSPGRSIRLACGLVRISRRAASGMLGVIRAPAETTRASAHRRRRARAARRRWSPPSPDRRRAAIAAHSAGARPPRGRWRHLPACPS